MGLAQLTQSHGWKNFMAKLYGIGASVVIIGALFKILHWPGANYMLMAGLGTEAIIFFFSAFEPLHEELDWTLVYPQLAGLDEDDTIEFPETSGSKSSGEALSKFDEMLEKAGGSELFDKLGAGLANLTEKVDQMSELSDATIATKEFSEKVKTAANSVSEFGEISKQSAESLSYSVENLSDTFSKTAQEVSEKNGNVVAAYERLAESMDIDFSALKEGNQQYSEQVGILNKNLTALNAIFELQLSDADLDKMMEDLNGSVKQSAKYHSEIKKLGARLEALNNIYGNMLSAMNVNVND